MIVYLAAVYTNGYMKGQDRYVNLNDNETVLVDSLNNILELYHYVNKQRYVDQMRHNGATVFLDSGAFSAHTLNVEINLETYCNYIKKNIDIIRVEDNSLMASVLDGIGDVKKTFDNQLEMERHGVRPLPCFHFGEDERYLEWYIKNYNYITIGGMVPIPTNKLFIWLDRIWNKYLTDASGNAKIKVHGFGLTSVELMSSYPWYSCDSSSWIQSAAFGGIYTHEHKNISVSSKSPSRHTRGQHFSTLAKVEREAISRLLHSKGFSIERLSTIYESRAAYNLNSYNQLSEIITNLGSSKFRNTYMELF